MIPQDARSPHQQQRWIEIYNAGSSDIPPFGVVEIVESTRPEDGGITGEGPTVVSVRRPTIDSLPHFIINGPMTVPVGERGRVATNDYPCLAMYDTGETPVSGQEWGTVIDSYALGRGRQGVVIMGDAAYGVVRVMRSERLLRVTPVSDALMPGDTATCTVLRWNGSAWVATSTVIPVADPMYRTCALPGEEFWCEAYGESFQTVSEFGLRRRAIALENIANNTVGDITLSSLTPPPSPACEGDRLGPIVSACYRTSGGSSILADAELFAHYHPEFRRWFILPDGTSVVMVKATGCLFPGQTANGLLMQYNAATLEWEDTATVITIGDPGYWNCLLPGEIAFARVNASNVYDLVGSYGLTRKGKVVDNIPCGQSGEVVLYSDESASCGSTASNCSVTACNDWGEVRKVLAEEEVLLSYHGTNPQSFTSERRWTIIPKYEPRWAIGTLSADLCPDDATASVSSVDEYADGCPTPPASGTFLNTFQLSGTSGLAVLLFRKEDGDWVVTQVQHVGTYVVYNVELSQTTGQEGCDIVVTAYREQMSVMSCGEVDTVSSTIEGSEVDVVTDWEVVHVAGNYSASQGPQAGSCTINVTKERKCLLLPSSASTTIEQISLTPTVVVQDIDYGDGYCLEGVVSVIYGLCDEESATVELLCGDPCDVSSGV